MKIPIVFFVLVFFIGLVYYVKFNDNIEGFAAATAHRRCPNLLIQKGAKILLFNSNLAKVPGVNPIEFHNLEEYTEFLDWQRSQNIRCPVLFLQQSYDTQGNEVFKVRPSVSNPMSGLPPSSPLAPPAPPQQSTLLVDATRNDPSYNINSYPAFDSTSYYVGTTTPLDGITNKVSKQSKVSPDPMDPNWGGASYTQGLIDSGYYKIN
jgi:hypothetical protein